MLTNLNKLNSQNYNSLPKKNNNLIDVFTTGLKYN